MLYFLYVCSMSTENPRPKRVQTAFRLDAMLLQRLKAKARAQGKSLNAYVEEELFRLAPAEPEWPHVVFPIVPKGRIAELGQNFPKVTITKEMLEEDDRLAYLLGKCGIQ